MLSPDTSEKQERRISFFTRRELTALSHTDNSECSTSCSLQFTVRSCVEKLPGVRLPVALHPHSSQFHCCLRQPCGLGPAVASENTVAPQPMHKHESSAAYACCLQRQQQQRQSYDEVHSNSVGAVRSCSDLSVSRGASSFFLISVSLPLSRMDGGSGPVRPRSWRIQQFSEII